MEMLVIKQGLFKDARYPLTAPQMTIGRSLGCEIRLPDRSLSRRHAQVNRVGDRLQIVDLGSLNGTFVNRKRLKKPADLAEGDVIRVGDVHLRFEVVADEKSVPPRDNALGPRGQIDALFHFQTQVRQIQSWKTVTALLLQAICPFLRKGAEIQFAQEMEDGRFISYSPLGDATMLPLPGHSQIQDTLKKEAPIRLSLTEAIIPFPPKVVPPIRAVHIISEELSDAEIEMASHAVEIAALTPAFAPGSREPTTVILNPRAVNIVGTSPPIQAMLEQVYRAATASGPVLILGESGSGKELVARAIHTLSILSEDPFIAVNCAGFSQELIDSELFGYEKGAFTGANRSKKGLFEEAEDGILFLDEVAELPSSAQAKLLRALDTGEIRPVGSNQVVRLNARVIFATNKDLEAEVEEGRFRHDLYFRIAGFVIRVPPLRERREDIPLLIDHILDDLAQREGISPPIITNSAMERLTALEWVGNVRELQQAIRRLAYTFQGKKVSGEDIRATEPAEPSIPLRSLNEVEREHIIAILKQVEGNKSRAAQILGITRATLYKKLKDFSIPDG